MSTQRRPRYGGSSRRAEEERKQAKKIAFRVILFALAVLLACVLRLGQSDSLQTIRQKATDILSGTTDYKEAVETLGRAASGEKTEDGENPVAVFGRMLLGLSEDTP
ncbi:MAG: hypothetical protein VB086_09405 [Clostridiaceae bacterium]|nr:hypothetical protein [Clostridiaceae bacterium]